MIHPELLEILCCPETRQPVRPAPGAVLEQLQRAEKAGGGGSASQALTGALIREDGKFLYPIRNGIPIMLIEERIAVPDPAGAPAGASDEDVEENREPQHHQVEPEAGA